MDPLLALVLTFGIFVGALLGAIALILRGNVRVSASRDAVSLYARTSAPRSASAPAEAGNAAVEKMIVIDHNEGNIQM